MAKKAGKIRAQSTAKQRTPMSDAQRAAASERLAASRLARGHDGSGSVHKDLHGVDEESPLHWKKVKQWIKEIQVELNAKKSMKDSKESKERQEFITLKVYQDNLKKYLASGVYSDARYGRMREGRMLTISRTMAYHADGYPKRTVGFIYPDLGGQAWTKEMDIEQNSDRGITIDTHAGSSKRRKSVPKQKSV